MTRDRYRHWEAIAARWRDNDAYGHVNNAVYYEYFDSVINRYLIDNGLDIHGGESIALAVSSSCEFTAPLSFPMTIDAGLLVIKLGTSSIHYEVGLFGEEQDDAAAVGTFVHVFVDRATRQPVPIPDPIRTALEELLAASP